MLVHLSCLEDCSSEQQLTPLPQTLHATDECLQKKRVHEDGPSVRPLQPKEGPSALQSAEDRPAIHDWPNKTLPASAPSLLSAAGCLCIAQECADSSTCIPPEDVPMIAALEASAGHSALDLSKLIRTQRLGHDRLHTFCQLLANHLPFSSHMSQRVWPVLKQFSIFETADGSMIDLANDQLQLLPNPSWESLICTACHTVPWKVIVYFTGSDAQRKLLRQSDLKAPDIPIFLDQTLLGSIQNLKGRCCTGLAEACASGPGRLPQL